MKALKEILIKNEWFTRQEIEKLFTSEIQECINECTRPNQSDIFNAFDGLRPQDVKVLIIGQDPYPDEAKAHGLAFSYNNGEIPAEDSLLNIFRKISEDVGIDNSYTNLSVWKKQGVLLLNTALTFAPNNQDFHIKAWHNFVNHVISKLLEVKTKDTIEGLSDTQVIELLKAKWIQPLIQSLMKLPDRIVNELVSKIETLAKKYETTFAEVETEIADTQAALSAMIDELEGSDFDMLGLQEFKKMLGGFAK